MIKISSTRNKIGTMNYQLVMTHEFTLLYIFVNICYSCVDHCTKSLIDVPQVNQVNKEYFLYFEHDSKLLLQDKLLTKECTLFDY